jgi:hypothetical protein
MPCLLWFQVYRATKTLDKKIVERKGATTEREQRPEGLALFRADDGQTGSYGETAG